MTRPFVTEPSPHTAHPRRVIRARLFAIDGSTTHTRVNKWQRTGMPHWTKPSGSDDHPNDVQTMRSWPIYTRVITPPMHICVSLRVKESRMFGYVGISRNFTIRFVVLNAKILHNSNRQALLANTNRRSYSSVTLVTRIEQSTVVLAHSGKLVVLFPSELSTTTLQTSCATYTDRMKYECSRNGR